MCLSHMALISIPLSRSLSPCRKNSSMIRSVHCLYKGKCLVGLLRSAQCTMFLSTYDHTRIFNVMYVILSLRGQTLLIKLPVFVLYSGPEVARQNLSPSWSPPLSLNQPAVSCVWTCLWPTPAENDRKKCKLLSARSFYFASLNL